MEREFFGDLNQESIQASAARGMIGETSLRFRNSESVAERLKGITKVRSGEMLTWDARTGKFKSAIKDDRDVLSDGWAKFVEFYGWPRIELTHLNPELWIDTTSAFAQKAHASSINIHQGCPAGEVRWNWPLRIGFLEDQESQGLRSAVAELVGVKSSPWRSHYIHVCSTLDMKGLGCHILLIPGALKEALDKLHSLHDVIRAASVLVLSAGKERSHDLLPPIRLTARSDCIALLHLPDAPLRSWGSKFVPGLNTYPQFLAAWFIEMVRELSHDEPLDIAIFRRWRAIPHTQAPVLMSSRRLINDTRISRRLTRLTSQFRNPLIKDVEFYCGPETAKRCDLQPGLFTFQDFAREIQAKADKHHYNFEGDMGSAVLDLVDVRREALAQQEQEHPRPPRWVQAKVYDAKGSIPTDGAAPARKTHVGKRSRVFRPGGAHVVEVFIGPREEDAIKPPKGAPPLPEEGLPGDRGVPLTIVFAESRTNRHPQIKTVWLPRSGRSKSCWFGVEVSETAQRLEARIIVMYRNRALQTSILRGPVGAAKRGGAASKRARITIAPEGMSHDMNGLEFRSDFDATIVLDHRRKGPRTMTAVRDKKADHFELPENIQDYIKTFDGIMEDHADQADETTAIQYDLKSKSNVKLLADLARTGATLWANVRERLKQAKAIDLAQCDRIQVVCADPDARLPIEYFYDRVAPNEGAKLCDNAVNALQTGRCDHCESLQNGSVVCPIGFWGLSRVLERHMYQRGEKEVTELRSVTPVNDRRHLKVLSASLFAASHVVDKIEKGGIDSVNKVLRGIWTIGPAEAILNWTDWKKYLSQEPANLLFIMPHVLKKYEPMMEIGANSRLFASNIIEHHASLSSCKVGEAPVVVLLGCQTGGTAQVPLDTLVAPFRQSGAAIVLCTGASIVGRHAVPVATALLTALNDAANSPTPISFGDVVTQIRRTIVLLGFPMVFTVLAFGDFDWQIGKAPAAPSKGQGATAATGLAVRKEGALATP